MSIRIRLTRTGKKHQPSYRIVVANSRTKRNGKVIETLGFYTPLTEPATIKVDRARFDYWLAVGAQPSDPVRALVLGQKRKGTRVKERKKSEARDLSPKPNIKNKKSTHSTSSGLRLRGRSDSRRLMLSKVEASKTHT